MSEGVKLEGFNKVSEYAYVLEAEQNARGSFQLKVIIKSNSLIQMIELTVKTLEDFKNLMNMKGLPVQEKR